MANQLGGRLVTAMLAWALLAGAAAARSGAIKAPVPQVPQTTDYSCGAAALAAVLSYYGVATDERQVMREARSDPQEGTPPLALQRVARAHGLQAEIRTGMTIAQVTGYLDRGAPVILDIQAYAKDPRGYATNWEDGHYVVAIGYDSKGLLFMDPSLPKATGYLTRAELLARWRDYENVGKGRVQRYVRAGIPVVGRPNPRLSRPTMPVAHID